MAYCGGAREASLAGDIASGVERQMSREQRRADQKKPTGAAPPSRRTPQKVKTDSGFPTVPVAIVGGLILIIALLAYLIIQARDNTVELSADQKAEQDDSPDLPGAFFPSQGRGHFEGGLVGHVMVPFCDDVEASELASERSGVPYGETPSGTVTSTSTPTSTSTATPSPTTGADTTPETPNTTPTVPTDCHSSNPPSSGRHLGVQRGIDIGGGAVINIPPDPDVYPHDVEIPRDAIAHALEHAGVYIGWNCADGDQACLDVVQQAEDLANDRIDNNDNRVIMAINLDLPVGTIAVASWTRVLSVPYTEYDENAFTDFISTHSCRFDPEGFC